MIDNLLAFFGLIFVIFKFFYENTNLNLSIKMISTLQSLTIFIIAVIIVGLLKFYYLLYLPLEVSGITLIIASLLGIFQTIFLLSLSIKYQLNSNNYEIIIKRVKLLFFRPKYEKNINKITLLVIVILCISPILSYVSIEENGLQIIPILFGVIILILSLITFYKINRILFSEPKICKVYLDSEYQIHFEQKKFIIAKLLEDKPNFLIIKRGSSIIEFSKNHIFYETDTIYSSLKASLLDFIDLLKKLEKEVSSLNELYLYPNKHLIQLARKIISHDVLGLVCDYSDYANISFIANYESILTNKASPFLVIVTRHSNNSYEKELLNKIFYAEKEIQIIKSKIDNLFNSSDL